MSHRALVLLILGVACAAACEGTELRGDTVYQGPTGTFVGAPQPTEFTLEQTPCGTPAACVSGFTVTLDASEPWPLGSYFLRVSFDHGLPTVCKIAFEPVVGAVTDTCDDEERGFRVTYRYDDEVRAIEEVSFGGALRVDMDILIAEDLPAVVEVHHDVLVQKCSYSCPAGEPLTVPVRFRRALQSGDAGIADAGKGVADAGTDAAL